MIQVDDRTFADLAVAVYRVSDAWRALLECAARDPRAQLSGVLLPYAAELSRCHDTVLDLMQAVVSASDAEKVVKVPPLQ